jgi:hypothetical protein
VEKLKDPAFENFINHMLKMGARLWVNFQDGCELELPLPSLPSATQTIPEK